MLDITDYQYDLPTDFIATKPAEPRDNSRMLIYDTHKDKVTCDYFYHLDRFLPKQSFLVLNETKVEKKPVKVETNVIKNEKANKVADISKKPLKEDDLFAALMSEVKICGVKKTSVKK